MTKMTTGTGTTETTAATIHLVVYYSEVANDNSSKLRGGRDYHKAEKNTSTNRNWQASYIVKKTEQAQESAQRSSNTQAKAPVPAPAAGSPGSDGRKRGHPHHRHHQKRTGSLLLCDNADNFL